MARRALGGTIAVVVPAGAEPIVGAAPRLAVRKYLLPPGCVPRSGGGWATRAGDGQKVGCLAVVGSSWRGSTAGTPVRWHNPRQEGNDLRRLIWAAIAALGADGDFGPAGRVRSRTGRS